MCDSHFGLKVCEHSGFFFLVAFSRSLIAFSALSTAFKWRVSNLWILFFISAKVLFFITTIIRTSFATV